jgi:hypothetical protein
MKKRTIVVNKVKDSNNVTRAINSSALLFLYSDSESVNMVNLRPKIFRINKVQAPMQEKNTSIKSKEKLLPDHNVLAIEETQYNQNDITDPSIMINSRNLNPSNVRLEKVGNWNLNNNINRSTLIENYAHILIRNLRPVNNNKNKDKSSYYRTVGL